MRRTSIALLAAILAAGCGAPDTSTLQQKQDAQASEQKQADDDEMRSRKESDSMGKKPKK